MYIQRRYERFKMNFLFTVHINSFQKNDTAPVLQRKMHSWTSIDPLVHPKTLKTQTELRPKQIHGNNVTMPSNSSSNHVSLASKSFICRKHGYFYMLQTIMVHTFNRVKKYTYEKLSRRFWRNARFIIARRYNKVVKSVSHRQTSSFYKVA